MSSHLLAYAVYHSYPVSQQTLPCRPASPLIVAPKWPPRPSRSASICFECMATPGWYSAPSLSTQPPISARGCANSPVPVVRYLCIYSTRPVLAPALPLFAKGLGEGGRRQSRLGSGSVGGYPAFFASLRVLAPGDLRARPSRFLNSFFVHLQSMLYVPQSIPLPPSPRQKGFVTLLLHGSTCLFICSVRPLLSLLLTLNPSVVVVGSKPSFTFTVHNTSVSQACSILSHSLFIVALISHHTPCPSPLYTQLLLPTKQK